MATYTVQARFDHQGRLHHVGTYTAHSNLGAIRQALAILAGNGEDAVELVATKEEPNA